MEQPGGVGYGQSHLIGDLTFAAMMGNMQRVRQIVEQHPEIIDATDAHGDTALRKACRNGHREIMAYLLDKGANINQYNGVTSLFLEVLWKNDMAVLNVLLERDVNLGGFNILAFASANGDVDAVTAMLKLKQIRNTINARTTSGATALLIATWDCNTEIIKLLLQAGADPHVSRNSCFDVSKAEGHSQCIRLLQVSSQQTNPRIIIGL